jgi:putative membrane protein
VTKVRLTRVDQAPSGTCRTASTNTWAQYDIWCFAALLPLCVINEFDRLNDAVAGLLAGQMAWFAIPFSALVSWMYVSLDQVGESTENPFEGSANDVPISHISRLVEIELGEILGETRLPPLLRARNEIIL